jgi:acetoin utilization protein AcuB
MEASDIMQRDVVVVAPSATLKEASEVMHSSDIRHLPVLEGGDVVGIISDRDLRCYLAELYRSGEGDGEPPLSSRSVVLVRDVMQRKPVSVLPDSDLGEVVDSMLEFKIGAVLVLDPAGHLMGVVSYEDVIRAAMDLG